MQGFELDCGGSSDWHLRDLTSLLLVNSIVSPVNTIDLSQALFKFANGNMSVISLLDIRWLLLHALLDFIAMESARIRREVLIQFPVERLLIVDHEVLKDPHVALVEETIHSDKHVGMNRIEHLFDLQTITT